MKQLVWGLEVPPGAVSSLRQHRCVPLIMLSKETLRLFAITVQISIISDPSFISHFGIPSITGPSK